MNIDSEVKLRLQFLARVVARERVHLNTTTNRLFASPFTTEIAQQLETNDDLSERVEAFVSRFSRLQDTIGDKFIPQLLIALGEKPASAMDNLDKAERFGWIPSSDEWQAMRKLRNQMVHEYIEDIEVLTSAIQTAKLFVPKLSEVVNELLNELKKREWAE